MPDGDVVLVTELPTFAIVDDHLQFTIVSGSRRRVFRMPRVLGWATANACIDALGEGPPPDNVKPFKRRDRPHT